MKRYLLLGLVVTGCLLATVGARLYYTHRYIPIRTVQPIMKLLDDGTRNSIEEGTYRVRGLMIVQYPEGRSGMERDPNRIKITGAGALEVKRALLRAMENATDPATLHFLLACVINAREEGNLVFQGEKEWAIIGAAAERQSANPWQNVRFFVTKDTNNVTVLGIGWTHNIP
jgi:hypothetical protein